MRTPLADATRHQVRDTARLALQSAVAAALGFSILQAEPELQTLLNALRFGLDEIEDSLAALLELSPAG